MQDIFIKHREVDRGCFDTRYYLTKKGLVDHGEGLKLDLFAMCRIVLKKHYAAHDTRISDEDLVFGAYVKVLEVYERSKYDLAKPFNFFYSVVARSFLNLFRDNKKWYEREKDYLDLARSKNTAGRKSNVKRPHEKM